MEYKVGDKVRIKKREGDPRNYPFSFINEMSDLSGQIFEITKIEDWASTHPCFKEDPHKYTLNEPGEFMWHSSMFEKVNDNSLKEFVVELPNVEVNVDSETTLIKIVL